MTPPSTTERLWQRHVFVCSNQRPADHPRPCCGTRGEDIRAWFKEGIKARGLARDVRANDAGCMEGCEAGPTVVVYPDAVWYSVRSRADVERILDEHLVAGRPVDDLRMDFGHLPAWQARQRRD